MGTGSIILFGVLFFTCPGPCGWDRQWLLDGNAGANENWGAIAQLGERYNGIVEVSGSIPLSSTKLFNKLKNTADQPGFYFAVKPIE